jgi:hypothetical protein
VPLGQAYASLRQRMRPSNMHLRPSASRMCPSNPDHPMWQRCNRHYGQSKSRFILSKVNKTLTLIGRTRTLSDMTDGRMDEMNGQDETDGHTDERDEMNGRDGQDGRTRRDRQTNKTDGRDAQTTLRTVDITLGQWLLREGMIPDSGC